MDAKKYNLPARVLLREISDKEIAIIKKRKSRIIQKDADMIIAQSKKIKQLDPHKKVSLVCKNNICSKAQAKLEEESIQVYIEQ